MLPDQLNWQLTGKNKLSSAVCYKLKLKVSSFLFSLTETKKFVVSLTEMDNHLMQIRTVFEPLALHQCALGSCEYQCVSALEFCHHLQNVHRKDPNFSSHCLFSVNCYHAEPFRSYSGLYKHLRTKHASFFDNHEEIILPEPDINNGYVPAAVGNYTLYFYCYWSV